MKESKWCEYVDKIKEELDMVDYGNLTNSNYQYVKNLIDLMKEYQKFEKKEHEKVEDKDDEKKMFVRFKFEPSDSGDLEMTLSDMCDTFRKLDEATKGNMEERALIKQKIKEVYSMFN